jgi:hypothetical protein
MAYNPKLGPTQFHIYVSTGRFYSGVKRPRSEANNFTSSKAEVNKGQIRTLGLYHALHGAIVTEEQE